VKIVEQNAQMSYNFGAYRKIEFNLKAEESVLKTMQYDLEHYIASQGPKEYQAQDYTKISLGSSNVIPTDEFFKELLKKQRAVNEQLNHVNKLRTEFENLKAQIREMQKKYSEDPKLSVFCLHIIDGLSLQTVRRIKNYAYGTVRNASSEIKREMRG
jgi:protein tyrosine phosphatase